MGLSCTYKKIQDTHFRSVVLDDELVLYKMFGETKGLGNSVSWNRHRPYTRFGILNHFAQLTKPALKSVKPGSRRKVCTHICCGAATFLIKSATLIRNGPAAKNLEPL